MYEYICIYCAYLLLWLMDRNEGEHTENNDSESHKERFSVNSWDGHCGGEDFLVLILSPPCSSVASLSNQSLLGSALKSQDQLS
jgi:hypothetical protein